jgi:hypothetical protein
LKVAPAAWLALLGAALTYALGLAGVFPWPLLAARSLAVIFLLAAITRIGGDFGLQAQRKLRWAVGGVALTAGAWFVGAATLLGAREFTVLGFLHIVAAWLTAAREPDPADRTRGWLILSSTATTVSLLALAALPVAAHVPGAPILPLALAAIAIVGATQIAQGRMVGLVLAAVAGVVTLALTIDVFLDLLSYGAAFAPALGRSAPLLATTATLGALAPIVRLAISLPELLRVLAPNVSPALRRALAVASLPALLLASVALI